METYEAATRVVALASMIMKSLQVRIEQRMNLSVVVRSESLQTIFCALGPAMVRAVGAGKVRRANACEYAAVGALYVIDAAKGDLLVGCVLCKMSGHVNSRGDEILATPAQTVRARGSRYIRAASVTRLKIHIAHHLGETHRQACNE